MFGSSVLEVAIGLFFLYWLLSLLASRIQELLTATLGDRGRDLRKCIEDLLGKEADFFGHKRIQSLMTDKGEPPSYIDPLVFADTVIDLLTLSADDLRTEADLSAALRREGVPQRALRLRAADLLPRASADEDASPVERLRAGLAAAYTQAMAHLSGRFRRKSQWRLLLISAVLTVALNVDSLALINAMSRQPAMREAVARAAATVSQDSPASSPASSPISGIQQVARDVSDVGELGLPLGWNSTERSFEMPRSLLGWLMTIIAVSFGAPFWFDLINRIASARSGSNPPPATPSQKTPDPSAPAATGAARTTAKATAMPASIVFNPDATDFDRGNARFLALASQLAYDSNWNTILAAIAPHGFAGGQTFDHKGTQGFVATGPRAVLLAFRGTEPKRLEDIFTDLNFPFTTGEFGGDQVHGGFKIALNEAWTNSQNNDPDKVDRLLQAESTTPRPLWITGHSLGGALALLAAARLHRAASPLPLRGVCTFGAPRVGDKLFNQRFNADLERLTYNVVNGQDIVTRLPPWLMEYRHVGRRFRLAGDGSLVEDRGGWFTEMIDTLVNAFEKDWKQLAKVAVQDHAMTIYRARLDAGAA